MTNTPKPQGKWRTHFFPIERHEYPKFFALAFIFFCFLFCFNIVHDIKDTLLINAAGVGVLNFVKLYGVAPLAIIFVITYAKLANVVSREVIFYVVTIPFIIFFALFGYVLYPYQDFLLPDDNTIQSLKEAHPHLINFIDIYANWLYALFYVIAELWGTIMVVFIFWQFANSCVTLQESKRYYGLFVVIGNTALVFSGQTTRFFSTGIRDYYPAGFDVWEVSLYWLIGFFLFFACCAIALYRWLFHKKIVTESSLSKMGKDLDKKPGLMESFRIILSAPALGFIALLVISYGLCINFLEIQWKEQMRQYFCGDKGSYNAFMGNVSTLLGLTTITFTLFIGTHILKRMKWATVALIPPLCMMVGGIALFGMVIGDYFNPDYLQQCHIDGITFSTFFGAFIVLCMKMIKYCFFDPTKEMAYIPLNDTLKTKGKAAVDLLSYHTGKSGSAFLQTSLLMIMTTTNVVPTAPYVFIIFIIMTGAWVYAVKGLSKIVDKNNKSIEEQ